MVSLARTTRRIATAAAYGGGGITVLGVAMVSLLFTEAVLARWRVGLPDGDPPPCDGLYGNGDGEPISLVMLGDSTAAGLGVREPYETPGALLATGLAESAARQVRLRCVAKSGAGSADLDRQVELALAADPDIAVIFIGANDVTHPVTPSESVRHLAAVVRRLRATGVEVVVGTCPDLGTVQPIANPLRWLARRWSRYLAAMQTMAVVEAGGRTVALCDLLGPDFAANPAEMFGPDRFHPSAQGYAQAAYTVLPSVCAALGLRREAEFPADTQRSEAILPIELAAAEAAEVPGTEVARTEVAGSDHGPRGRWARLARRRQDVPAATGLPALDEGH